MKSGFEWYVFWSELAAGLFIVIFTVWLTFLCRFLNDIKAKIDQTMAAVQKLRNDFRRDFYNMGLDFEKRLTALEEHEKSGENYRKG